MPGEPAVVALRCLMAATWPGWSLLQPLEKERSTICRWPSEPMPGVDGRSGTCTFNGIYFRIYGTSICNYALILCVKKRSSVQKGWDVSLVFLTFSTRIMLCSNYIQ